ncbi:MAG: hypothetical protein D4S01_08770 [Dehalococcoidia bacterium]|nr:MAG: hypothetical protein D4S01_08770 [Dehalococcoidia bacterium]
MPNKFQPKIYIDKTRFLLLMIAYFDDLNVTNAEHQKSCFKHYMNATSNIFTYFFPGICHSWKYRLYLKKSKYALR